MSKNNSLNTRVENMSGRHAYLDFFFVCTKNCFFLEINFNYICKTLFAEVQYMEGNVDSDLVIDSDLQQSSANANASNNRKYITYF